MRVSTILALFMFCIALQAQAAITIIKGGSGTIPLKDEELTDWSQFNLSADQAAKVEDKYSLEELNLSKEAVLDFLNVYPFSGSQTDKKGDFLYIGYGERDPETVFGIGLTEEEAFQMFMKRAEESVQFVKSHDQITELSDTQFDTLVGLHLFTGTIDHVSTSARKIPLLDAILDDDLDYVGSVLSHARIGNLAEILMFGQYGRSSKSRQKMADVKQFKRRNCSKGIMVQNISKVQDLQRCYKLEGDLPDEIKKSYPFLYEMVAESVNLNCMVAHGKCASSTSVRF